MSKETKVFGHDDVLMSAMKQDDDKHQWRKITIVAAANSDIPTAQSIVIWDKQVDELMKACQFLERKNDGQS